MKFSLKTDNYKNFDMYKDNVMKPAHTLFPLAVTRIYSRLTSQTKDTILQ